MLSLNSPPDKGKLPAEKLFGDKLRAPFPLLKSSTKNAATEQANITQNLKLPELASGTTVWIWIDKQNVRDKKFIIVSQDNYP